MAKTTSVQRTMRQLRQEGHICAVVERWLAYAASPTGQGPPGIRQDLFGFLDIISLAPDAIVGIQCTTGSGHPQHKAKILANEIAPEWLKSGGRIQIWTWRKLLVKRGGKAMRWTPRIEEITLEDFR